MQIEATGKSVEIAIQNGLLECGMKREEVDVKVVEQGGLFKKAKVILSWGEQKEQVEELKEEPENEVTTETEVSEISTEIEENNEQTEEKTEKPKRVVDTTRLQQKGCEFLLGLARLVDENATVECEAGENQVNYSVKGEKLGKLIGYHGENIHAIQLLLSGIKLRSEGPVRLYLDIDGYKANKNQTLIDLANKIADQAVKIERNIHLDPMSAYDRRIIHTTLQERDDVTTESTGEGERRHVVVKPTFRR